MSPDLVRRIARFHASQPGCRPFIDPRHSEFTEKVWRQHFESDRKRLHRPRIRNEAEVEAIAAFLSKSSGSGGEAR